MLTPEERSLMPYLMERWDREGQQMHDAMREREREFPAKLERMIEIWQERLSDVAKLTERERINAELAICEARRALKIARELIDAAQRKEQQQ